jgi:hypothetical protein
MTNHELPISVNWVRSLDGSASSNGTLQSNISDQAIFVVNQCYSTAVKSLPLQSRLIQSYARNSLSSAAARVSAYLTLKYLFS